MPKILFDSSHNEYLRFGKWGVPYLDNLPQRFDWQEMAFTLANFGFDLAILDGGRIPSGLSEMTDIFVLGEPESHFFHSWPDVKRTAPDGEKRGLLSLEEINNLLEFVRSGGGLLVFQEKYGEQRRGNNINTLVRNFGVFFNDDLVETDHKFKGHSSWLRVDNFEKHPVTEGIKSIIYFDGCSMIVEKSAKTLAFTDDTAHPPKVPIVAVAEYGKGRVVCMGDATLFTEWGLGQDFEFREEHAHLLWNIFRWLTPTHFTKDKNSNKVAGTSDILSPIIINNLRSIRQNINDVKSQHNADNENMSQQFDKLSMHSEQTSKLAQRIYEVVCELPRDDEEKATLGYWLRTVDVFVDFLLIVAAFSLGLLLTDKMLPASAGALTVIVILAAIAAFALKIFCIPIMRSKKRK